MIQISSQWMLFLLDASTKALLLAIIAGVALKILKQRNANVQHCVWAGVLAGMLLVPGLAAILPTVPLSIPVWTEIAESEGGAPENANDTRTDGDTIADKGGIKTVEPEAEAKQSTTDLENANKASESDLLANGDVLPDRDGSSLADGGETAEQDTNRRQVEPAIATTFALFFEWNTAVVLRRLVGVLFAFWAIISLILAVRLVAGLLSSARLRRRSVAVDGPMIEDCLAQLPTSMSRLAPTIRESKEVLVPVTVGWLRPTVLLPEEWRTWPLAKLTAIVAHEFTHIARRDFFVALAAEINRCLYWFHPVSWWLRSRLSDLAEEACDDAAIGHTGDRTGYARHLLEVATTLTHGCGRRVQPGLSMARESNVESRIATILDFKRPLSGRLTRGAATVIALVMFVVIASFAAIHPVLAIPESPELSPAREADKKDKEGVAKTTRVYGQVADSDGEPIADARVRLYRSMQSDWYAAQSDSTLIAELDVDAKGNFDQHIATDQLPNEANTYNDWAVLVATAPKYAPTVMQRSLTVRAVDAAGKDKPNFLKERVVLKLGREVVIRGRVLSIEGQPIEGATVSVFHVSRPNVTRLKAWLKQTSKVPLTSSNDMTAMMPGAPPSRDQFFPAEEKLDAPSGCITPVQTNRDGVFEFPGLLAKDDLAVLRIQGDGITNATVHVLAREMKTVYGRHTTNFSVSGAYYGREFDFIAQAGTSVFGVVRDIESQEPLVGIPVAVGGVYGTTMSHTGYIVTKTDEQGRYRIDGLPIEPAGVRRYQGNYLAVRAGDLPYIENEILPIPASDGLAPVEFDIELRRGVMAKGQLTDKATGKPVIADIYFTPFLTNENNSQYKRYADDVTRMLGNTSRYRRVKENASVGTDHGTSGPVFVAGEAVNAGILSQYPSLAEIVDGDLPTTIDFRSIYASVLSDWLGVNAEVPLGGMFKPLKVTA